MNITPYIYRVYIKKTKKYYIGQHNGKNKNYMGSGTAYKSDYKMYVKNIKHDIKKEILEFVPDIKNLNKREEYWLNLFNVKDNPSYYNKTNNAYGGNRTGIVLSYKTRNKISISKKGTKAWNKNLPNTWTPKIRMKRILQYSINGKFIRKFNSIKSASIYTSIQCGDICNSCQGYYRHAGNYLWFYETEFSKKLLKTRIKFVNSGWNSLKRPIIRINKNKTIKEYESTMQAFRETGINNILNCLKRRQKTAGGYIWKYK